MTEPTQGKLFEEIPKIELAKDNQLLEITAEPKQDFSAPLPPPEVKPDKKPRRSKRNAPPIDIRDDEDYQNQFSSAPASSQEDEESLNATQTTLSAILPQGAAINTLDQVMRNLMPLALNSLIGQGSKLKPSHFALTPAEKKTIEPVLNDCLETVKLNFSNPWIALAVVVGAIYTSKGVATINLDSLEQQQEGNENAPFGYNKDGSIKKDGRGRRRI